MLGLSNLAAPYYSRVLDEAVIHGRKASREDLVVEAAYNLQAIYIASGNQQLARAVTNSWLVI